MCKKESILDIICGSGPTTGMIIGPAKGTSYKTTFTIGDIVKIAIKTTLQGSDVKQGSVSNAVIVRTKKPIVLVNDIRCSFNHNAAVLLDERYFPLTNNIVKFNIARSLLDVSIPGLLKLYQISKGF